MVGTIELALPPFLFPSPRPLTFAHQKLAPISCPAPTSPAVDSKFDTAVASLKEDLESTTGTADEALEKINAATNPAREGRSCVTRTS